MVLQALHVETEMKNLNIQVTLLMQKGVETPFLLHRTPLCGNALPHLFALDNINTWLRSHRRASGTQIHTAN